MSFAPAWAFARHNGDPAILLVTIDHPAWGAPYRLARNSEDVTSRGEVFAAAWFEADIVNDDNEIPKARLSLPNVNFEPGRKAHELTSPARVTLEVVQASDPDVVQYRAAWLELRTPAVAPQEVSGELIGLDRSTVPLGTKRVTPGRFPALYRSRAR